jgi:hypothetical protein
LGVTFWYKQLNFCREKQIHAHQLQHLGFCNTKHKNILLAS